MNYQPKYVPRDYQQDAIDSVVRAYQEGDNRTLVHVFTGGGKTSGVACNIPPAFPELTKHGLLFLSHRREILYQAYETFKEVYPDAWIGLEMGESHCVGAEDFIFASVDSIGRTTDDGSPSWRLLRKLRNRRFGIILADEGHHVTTDGVWDNILTFFGVGSDPSTHYLLEEGGRYHKPLLVLLTATPQRSDGASLAPFVDRIAATYGILYGIREGWLVDIRAYRVVFEENRKTGTTRIAQMVETWRRYANGLKTLVFAPDVSDSKSFADTINEHGLARAAHVDHKTPKDEREIIVQGFAGDEIDVLSNRLIFTEGYDNKAIRCLLDGAPTSSDPLHIQKLGRGLRPSSDAEIDKYKTAAERRQAIKNSRKPCLVYIATFDPTSHDLDLVASLFGIPKKLASRGELVVEEILAAVDEVKEAHPTRNIADVTSLAELKAEIDRVDLWSRTIEGDATTAITNLRWVSPGTDQYSIYLPENPFPANRLLADSPVVVHFKKGANDVWDQYVVHVGGWSPKIKKPVRGQVEKKGQTKDPVSAIAKFDRWLENRRPDIAKKVTRTIAGTPDERSKKYIKTNSIPAPVGLTGEQAEILIDNFRINRALEKQLKKIGD